ncbi:dynamin family protein [Corynebacterium doosanense]|uniref:dynamin family protein n=1 Tax=Corynebacterium doosanense TaxID=1121358 RepID=UPI0005709788|nr:dynamin family protein [Corynebacterium doosanense]
MTRPVAQTRRSPRESVERATQIIRRYGMERTAEHAVELMDTTFRAGTVVVIGEIKRGKSSLVNALVGHRNLLPVDVLTCTSAPIRVRVDPEIPADAAPRIALVRGDRRDPANAGDIVTWATQESVSGMVRSRDEEKIALIPTAVDIEMHLDDLGAVTVIDTPGVGGLDEHAVTAALQEANRAGLVLMVCDASTPITAPEMDILDRARTQTGGVIVVVTKTDKNLRRWRDIVEDDKRLIEKHVGVRLPVIGVSSLRAVDAAQADDPARRAELEERSGIAELRRMIRGHLENPSSSGQLAGVEAARGALHRIRGSISEDIAINTDSSAAVAELENERAGLERLREQAGEWEQLFQRDIALTRNRITDTLDGELDLLRQAWSRRIDSEGLRVLRAKPQVFTSQIETELVSVMDKTVSALLNEISDHTHRMFPDDAETRDAVMAVVLQSIGPREVSGPEVAKKTKDLLDPSMLTMGMVGAGLLTAVIPFAPLAGAAWIGVNAGFRAMRNGKQHLQQWLRETTATVKASTVRMMDMVITTARSEIMMSHRRNLKARSRELQLKIDEARTVARDSESERQARVATLNKNLDIVTATIRELDGHVDTLRAPAPAPTRDTPAGAPQ